MKQTFNQSVGNNMNAKINERKNIIASLKSNYGGQKKGVEKRIQYLKGMIVLNLGLTLISGTIVLTSIVLQPLEIEFFKWQRMGLSTILSLSFVLSLPQEIYELKLLNHLKKISDKSDFEGIEKLNSQLRIIVEKLNKKLRNNGLIILLAIVIMVFGIIQLLYKTPTPYWSYLKIPVLLFYGIVISKFLVINKKLMKNMNEVEKFAG